MTARCAFLLAAMAATSALNLAQAATVDHKQAPGAMIASAAIIPPGSTVYYLSGATGAPIDPKDLERDRATCPARPASP